jgi:hypothetical protein
MNALPFLKQVIAALDHFGDEPPKVGTLDADAEHDFRIAVGPQQIDFRLPRSSDVNMSRLMIECVDDEPEAVRTVYDNHASR